MSDDAADQYACTEALLEGTPDAAIVANLGVSSYILIDIDDRDEHFYMTSGMGVTTPLGLGLATAVDDQVTVLDGDGSLLMSLNCLATVGTHGPSNLTIVVWDNSEFTTTGGQSTLAPTADFAGVARDCGLAAWEATSVEEFRAAYESAVDHDGPALVNCAVTSERPADYPSLDYGHSYMKHRFREAMGDR